MAAFESVLFQLRQTPTQPLEYVYEYLTGYRRNLDYSRHDDWWNLAAVAAAAIREMQSVRAEGS